MEISEYLNFLLLYEGTHVFDLICNDFYFQKSRTVKCHNSSERQAVDSDVKYVICFKLMANHNYLFITFSHFFLQTSSKR